MLSPGVYRFGPFELDPGARRLRHDGEPVTLSDRYLDILHLLVSRAGQIVSKDALIDAAWKDVAVGDNSLEQAISLLRRTLGQAPGGAQYIQTLARRGYRFTAPVTQAATRTPDRALDDVLAPHCAFVEGRAALETLDLDAVIRARQVFEEVTAAYPDFAPGHVGLSSALALMVEATRAERGRDRKALVTATYHAGEACRLNPSYGEAWATLALTLHHSRETLRAIAAAQRAVALEPDNWRHQLRLAYVSWGEERLRSASRTLQLLPDLALAHWLRASVHIARENLAAAEHDAVGGATAQRRQHDGTRFRAAGLHLLLGLLRLASGDETAALEEFEQELAAPAMQVHTREARANAWCAIGAVRLRQHETAAAVDAFRRAVEAVSGHAPALAAQAVVTGDLSVHTELETRLQQLRDDGAVVEEAAARAIRDTLAGRPDRAARTLFAALERAPAGSAGWSVPVDPLLHVTACRPHWDDVLALLRSRAA